MKKSNYLNGKIYIIKFSNNDNHIYIGSTINSIKTRFSNHKCSHLNKQKTTISKYICEKYNNKWDKCNIELLLNYPCKNKKELVKKEYQIINKYVRNKKYIVLNKMGRKN